MGQETDGMWCILRTSGGRTLPLARSLEAAGFDVWTPTVIVNKRKPRSPASVKQPVAMFPTFVFARADRMVELQALSRMPVSGHPAFSIFRFDGEVRVVSDRELERVREAERRAVPQRKRRRVPVGATVRPDDGPYAGLSGVVRKSDGKFTLVAFGGWMEVQFETSSISSNAVTSVHPSGIAA